MAAQVAAHVADPALPPTLFRVHWYGIMEMAGPGRPPRNPYAPATLAIDIAGVCLVDVDHIKGGLLSLVSAALGDLRTVGHVTGSP